MTAVRNVYRVLRSVLFAAILTVAAVIVLSYLALSIPAVHERIKSVAEKELSSFLKAPVNIDRVTVMPFNEVRLNNVSVKTPDGVPCLSIEQLGAGISFWRLLLSGRVEITYAEIIGLRAKVTQEHDKGPLNIQFIIDAFKPKNPGTPPAKFDLKLHNVVIRKSVMWFDRLWKPLENPRKFDPNHVHVSNLSADVAMPVLKNDDYMVNLHRLSFQEETGLYVDALSLRAHITPEKISISNFKLKLKEGEIKINDQEITFGGFANIGRDLLKNHYDLDLRAYGISPAEFAFALPALDNVPGNYDLKMRVDGTPDNIVLDNFSLVSYDRALDVTLSGNLRGLPDFKSLEGSVDEFSLSCTGSGASDIMSAFHGIPSEAIEKADLAGNIYINAEGSFSMPMRKAFVEGAFNTSFGMLDIESLIGWGEDMIRGNVKGVTPGFDVAALVPGQPLQFVAANVESDFLLPLKRMSDSEGTVRLIVERAMVNGAELSDVSIEGEKKGSMVNAVIDSQCPLARGELAADCVLGAGGSYNVQGSNLVLNTSALGIGGKYPALFSLQDLYAHVEGDNPGNLSGQVRMSEFKCLPANGKEWQIRNFGLAVDGDNEERRINIDSDVLDGEVRGRFKFTELPAVTTEILSYALPAYISVPEHRASGTNTLSYSFTVKPDRGIYESFNVPVRPAVPVRAFGEVNNNDITLNISAPYLLKGNDKLIKDASLWLDATREKGLQVKGSLNYPAKNYVALNFDVRSLADRLTGSVAWNVENTLDRGVVNLGLDISRDDMRNTVFDFNIKDSDIVINGEKWILSPANALLSDKILTVDNLKISHGEQYLTIGGRASASSADSITARLNNIDLSYIFNTLNINYVTFGGFATGKAVASQLFSKTPRAFTRGLHVRDFSYNRANVGDAELSGYWDNDRKAIGLGADIDGKAPGKWTKVRGEIYPTRDSLGIDFDAHRINLALIRPFLSNVLEKVEGEGSARLTLYGGFKSISLVGEAFADTAAVKIAYNNVTYHGSDSVFFYKDRIHIPSFRVYDRYGRSAVFEGDVRHNYFHDASVDFRIRDIDRLLCYDTDSRSNPLWWGRIFGSGSGRISGRPGYTLISFNATTEPGSDFTFVLDEKETASEYKFLTFVDSHKQKEAEAISVSEEFESKYRAPQTGMTEEPSIFELDLSVGLNPGIEMNVIMDPSAGDKITARGSGAMRLNYNTFNDKIDMYGRYEINDGSYRFTFQDIIIRDFKIRSGSSVSFNGDPMRGVLNLTAGYRVNTNLSDLDKSFANDRDLNRSSVPVEALLKVSGDLTRPDLDFDISLPTVTGDVERKVRSIVSSEEMMQQQVLYLLALNRFYTPQYTGNADGELMSVASSTLSSQISNVISQITDKVSLNPSFKSDRSDFSDMEVDLALSSQLFDNRLILNGKLGYRDRSVSQTTFIGDFDLEYLLTKDGRFRLKAYNHFNDAYYYLKSALTTQGLGVIFRMDFDDAFKFLKPGRKVKKYSVPVTRKPESGTLRKDEAVPVKEESDNL